MEPVCIFITPGIIGSNRHTALSPLKDHVLLPLATELNAVDAAIRLILTDDIIHSIVSLIPDEWLVIDSPFTTAKEHRQAYEFFLINRSAQSAIFLKEAQDARK